MPAQQQPQHAGHDRADFDRQRDVDESDGIADAGGHTYTSLNASVGAEPGHYCGNTHTNLNEQPGPSDQRSPTIG